MNSSESQKPNSESKSPAQPRVVLEAFRTTRCAECGADVGVGDYFLFEEGNRHICLDCGGLGHLVFQPSGDTALTRRAVKHTTITAVVVKFSRSRKRNERQGVLVEPAALTQAEAECLDDEDARARSRERAALRRDALDGEYVKRFASHVTELYPGCPLAEARAIAEHACEKYSGRVGRSAAAKGLDDTAVSLAVRARIRHAHTRYDRLLMEGWDRAAARGAVAERIEEVARGWSQADA